MPTDAKRATVEELRGALADSTALIVSEYRGLTVGEIAEIRRSLRRSDVTYRVVKNRLVKIATADTDAQALAPMLNGPTAIAISRGDAASAAKAVIDATRPFKLVKITGAVLSGRAIDAEAVSRLAALPPRPVLHARLAGVMQAPIATLAGLLGANIRNLGYALAQLRDQKAAAGQ